jgi:hypothetical protein
MTDAEVSGGTGHHAERFATHKGRAWSIPPARCSIPATSSRSSITAELDRRAVTWSLPASVSIAGIAQPCGMGLILRQHLGHRSGRAPASTMTAFTAPRDASPGAGLAGYRYAITCWTAPPVDQIDQPGDGRRPFDPRSAAGDCMTSFGNRAGHCQPERAGRLSPHPAIEAALASCGSRGRGRTPRRRHWSVLPVSPPTPRQWCQPRPA